MQVNKVQNSNNTTNFKAKLKIDGEMFFGNVMDNMIAKAEKIGTEKDLIDIKYVGYYEGKSKKTGLIDKLKGTFVAKYVTKSNKSGSDKVRQDINDKTRYAYREKAKAAAIKYVDDLFEKYSDAKIK